MLEFSAFNEVDPIGLEPTTSTLPERKHPNVSHDEIRVNIQPGALVPPNVPPGEQQLCELITVWMNLDKTERDQLLSFVRTNFVLGSAESE